MFHTVSEFACVVIWAVPLVISLSLERIPDSDRSEVVSEITECFPQSVAVHGWPRGPSDFDRSWEGIPKPKGQTELSKFIAGRSGCTMAKTTAVASFGIPESTSNATLDSCRQCYLTFDGVFDYNHAGAFGFSPAQHCQCVTESAGRSRGNILGKRLVFIGDSMARQVFLRLIASLRGEASVLDHYFHCDAEYAFTPGEGDCLHIACMPNDDPCYINNTRTKQAVVIKFIFANHEQEGHHTPVLNSQLADPSIDATIVMSGYWFNPKDITSRDVTCHHCARGMTLQEQVDRISSPRVFFLSIPARVKLHIDTFSKFNDETREIVAKRAGSYFIDFDGLAKLADPNMSLRNAIDRTHFGCQVTPRIGHMTATSSLHLRALRGDEGHRFVDCSDPINLALVQAILMNLN